jgi:hypothetical protein
MIKKIAFMAGVFALAISVAAGSGLPTKAASAAANPLIISAVQTTGGEGKTNDDFIEIYNPNPEPFNLKDYRLVKRSAAGTSDSSIKSWSSDTFIPGYSFYLWANSEFTAISVVPDAVTSATLADNNGVALRLGANDTGPLVDSGAWGTTTNGFTSSGLANPISGQTIVRNSLFVNSGYSFGLSQPRNSGKQVLPETEEVPEVVTNDATCIFVEGDNGSSIDTIALKNTGNTTWQAPQYIVDGTNSEDFVLTSNQSIAPEQTLILDLQIPVPQQPGEYTYEWQMVYSNVKFGEKCSMMLNFTNSNETLPEEENPEPEPEQPEEEPEENSEVNDHAISITELLVNPEGKDDGQEKVELYNNGDVKINLSNWILDDIKAGSSLTTDKYVLPSIEINPKSYVVITLPAGKAVLNNTKGDAVSLLNADAEFIDTVEYVIASSPEGKAYSLIGNEWQWLAPSLGSANIVPEEENEEEEEEPKPTNVDIEDLKITEIYASPAKGEVEFLELFNSGDEKINLSNVTLKIGDSTKSLSDIDLLPGKYIALKGNQLPLVLLDKGAEIQLLEKDGSKIFSVTYPKGVKGRSYSKVDDKFAWTTTPTPGLVNKLTTVPEVNKEKTVVTKKTTTTTKTTPTKTTTKKTVVKKTTSNNPASIKSNNSLPKTNSLISTNENAGVEENTQGNKTGNKSVNVIAMIAASLGVGSFAIYKFGFSGF